MKFLVIATRREQVPVPPEAVPAILNADHAWLNDLVANGTLDFVYGFAVGGGGVAIANAKSGEELNSIIASSPANPLLVFEVRPLAKIDTTFSNAIEMFERMGEYLPAYR
jgi:muconolactone delta-isomerase